MDLYSFFLTETVDWPGHTGQKADAGKKKPIRFSDCARAFFRERLRSVPFKNFLGHFFLVIIIIIIIIISSLFFSTCHWLSAWSPKEKTIQSKCLYRPVHEQVVQDTDPPGKSAVESPQPGFCSKRQKTSKPATAPNKTTQIRTAAGKITKLVATIYIRAYTQSPLTSSASASASASSSLAIPSSSSHLHHHHHHHHLHHHHIHHHHHHHLLHHLLSLSLFLFPFSSYCFFARSCRSSLFAYFFWTPCNWELGQGVPGH